MSRGLFQKHCSLCLPQAWHIIQVFTYVMKTLKASSICLLNLFSLQKLRVPPPQVYQVYRKQHLPEAFSLRSALLCCHWCREVTASAPGDAIPLDCLSQLGRCFPCRCPLMHLKGKEWMQIGASPSWKSISHSWLGSWQKEACVAVTQRSDLLRGVFWSMV